MWDIIFEGVKTGIDTMKQIPVFGNVSLYHFCISLLFISIIIKIIPIVVLGGYTANSRASRAEAPREGYYPLPAEAWDDQPRIERR